MAHDTSRTTAEIRRKLTALASQDPKHQLFGASYHRYELGPPLPEKRLSAMEREYGARLPEDYRHFLLELGNGGAGPYYGLFRLGGSDSEDFTDCEALGTPFPWVEKVLLPRRPSI